MMRMRVYTALALWAALIAATVPGVRAEERLQDFTLTPAVNVDTLRLADHTDRIVLLAFFNAGDMPSIKSFKYLREWRRRYEGDGVRVLGVHCPRFPPMRDLTNVISVLGGAEIGFPVGLDPEGSVRDAYGLIRFPTFILARPGGEVVFRTSERIPYPEVEKAVQDLLKEMDPGIILPFPLKPMSPVEDREADILEPTPTLYLGYASGAIAGCDSTRYGRFADYVDPGDKDRDKVYLQGRWKVDEHSITFDFSGSSLEPHVRVVYAGKDLWILTGYEPGRPPGILIKQDRGFLTHEAWGPHVKFDHMGRSRVVISYPVPRHIVSNPHYGTHELTLVPDRPFSLYYFYAEGEVLKK
jgi:hypothetical protein